MLPGRDVTLILLAVAAENRIFAIIASRTVDNCREQRLLSRAACLPRRGSHLRRRHRSRPVTSRGSECGRGIVRAGDTVIPSLKRYQLREEHLESRRGVAVRSRSPGCFLSANIDVEDSYVLYARETRCHGRAR